MVLVAADGSSSMRHCRSALPLAQLAPPFDQTAHEKRHGVATDGPSLDHDNRRPFVHALARHAGDAHRDVGSLAEPDDD
eukprot:7974587-Pyramimonas_sp.AAC.1